MIYFFYTQKWKEVLYEVKLYSRRTDNLSAEEWDKIYLDFFMERLHQAEEDIKNGDVMTLDEFRKQLIIHSKRNFYSYFNSYINKN